MGDKVFFKKSKRIMTYSRITLNENSKSKKELVILENSLKIGDWTLEKEIEAYFFVSTYKYNWNNYAILTLTDKNGTSQQIRLGLSEGIDVLLSSVEESLNEYIVYNDWNESKLKQELERIKNLVNDLELKTIDKGAIIEIESCLKSISEILQ